MKEIWNNIKAELCAIDTSISNSFNKPADESEIESLISKFDKEIPLDFIEYLKTFNGQLHNNLEIQPFAYYSLIPVNEIIELIDIQHGLWKDEDDIDWVKENKIQPRIWDDNWLPFASDGTSFLIIDLNPGKNGVYGQIFQLINGMDYQEDDVVIEKSFKEFSIQLFNRLSIKDYEFDKDDIVINFNEDWI